MRSFLLAFVATLVPGIAAAGECPSDKVLPVAADASLAGIDLHRDKMQDVKDRFGKPSKAKWVLDEGGSWAKYKWVYGETALDSLTLHADQHWKQQQVSMFWFHAS